MKQTDNPISKNRIGRGNKPTTPRFQEAYVNREERFSLGIDHVAQRYYIAIPRQNHFLIYEEYYYIASDIYLRFPHTLAEIIKLAEQCRQEKNDSRLIFEPGKPRGVAL